MKEILCVLGLIAVCFTLFGDAQNANSRSVNRNNRNFRTVRRNGQIIHIVDTRTNNNRRNNFRNTNINTNRNNGRNSNRIILGTRRNTGQQRITIPTRSNIVAIVIRNPGMTGMISDLANTIMNSLRSLDRMFFRAGVDTKERSSTRAMKQMFTITKAKSKAMGEEERAKTAMIKQVSDQMQVTPLEVANSLDEIMDDMGVRIQGLTTTDDNCDQFVNIQCDRFSKYRTADGSCNNLKKPLWGRAFIPMRRFLQPEYDDKVSSPRTKGRNGDPLPSAREVSLKVHEAGSPRDFMRKTTHMLMQWGQFLDHDLTSTPIASGDEHSQVGCCSDELSQASLNNINMAPEDRDICFPIKINISDPQFGHTSCMSFVRSIQVSNVNCQVAPAEQMNQITGYIDGSGVYGSSEEETEALREFTGGLLKSSQNDLLPPDNQPSCLLTRRSDFCFKAGDARVNEQMALASMHTIWMREHNRMARELGDLNPDWDDETIFQETRRIVGAKIQHITYNEFLDIVMHQSHRRQYNVRPSGNGFGRDTYSEKIDASIRNAFATAAFRFGHSLVRTMFSEIDRGYQKRGNLMLVSSFGNVSHIFEDGGEGVNRYIRGLVTDKASLSDRFITPQVTQHLFADGAGHSLDLAALNMQRGRDHGLPGYNAWRKWCNLPVARTFDGLVDHNRDTREIFRKLYQHPDDIDLFAGGMSENALSGAAVGKTFLCILGHQFKALKDGDRFYYERNDRVTGFTQDQIRAIKETTLSKVLCDNTNIEEMQPRAFNIITQRNTRVSCSSLTQAPLTAWSERPLPPPTTEPPRTTPGPRTFGSAQWSPWSDFGNCVNGKRWRHRDCEVFGSVRARCVGPSSDSQVCRAGLDCSKSIYNTFNQFLCGGRR